MIKQLNTQARSTLLCMFMYNIYIFFQNKMINKEIYIKIANDTVIYIAYFQCLRIDLNNNVVYNKIKLSK